MSSRSRDLLLLALVLGAGAYFHFDVGRRARIDRGPKYHRTDFTVYQYAARALKTGDDPYEARNPRGYRYVYPPLLSVLLMPIADWEPQHAALVFFVLSMLALLGSVLALRRMVGGVWPPIIVAAIVCLGFAHQGFQRGQVTHILLYLQVAALACLLGRRFAGAGVLLGLGGALRLTPLLPAAAVGIGLLVAAVKGKGARPPLRFGLGLAGGLVLGFVVIPMAFLGPSRTQEVTERWVEVTQDVYRDHVDLEGQYHINEWRFKNQAPRRVYGTWLAWIDGRAFEGERPVAASDPDSLPHVQGVLASGTTMLLLLAAALLGMFRLRDPGHARFVVAFSVVTLLPVLMTRYTWPTHYLMAAPALVFAARRARSAAVFVLFAGTVLFYAAHWQPLQVVGQAGCLMLACAAFLLLVLLQASTDITRRYPPDGIGGRLYRDARLRAGGFGRLSALFPKKGLIVDLGCGMGLLGHVIVDEHPDRRVLAVDHDEQRVAQLAASADGLAIEARCADMASVEIPPCAGVALIDVLHYLDGDDQEVLLRRAAEALGPGGVLVLRDPDASARLRFPLARAHEKVALATGFTKARHGRYRASDDWIALLKSLGLETRRLPLGFSPYPDRIVVGTKP